MSVERVADEPVGGIATQLVAMGQTLLKAENDQMSTIAVMRPRDEKRILEGALQELDLAPEQAKAAYYSIPYKAVDENTHKPVTRYVQGLSIDGATALARRWGNCAVGGRILNEDDGGVDVEGVFLDFQTNFRMGKPHRASKYRKVRGQWVLADEQRLLMAVQSSVSKAQRNAIEAGLPPYLTGAYFDKARILTGGLPNDPADKKKVEAVCEAYLKRFKVTAEMLEESVGRPRADWFGEDVANLRGLFKALIDGSTTLADQWPAQAPKPADPAVVSVETLASGEVKEESAAKTEQSEADKKAVDAAVAAMEKGDAAAAAEALTGDLSKKAGELFK